MNKYIDRRFLPAGLWVLLLSATAMADVTSVEISARSPVADGAAFANAGAYEKLSGRLNFEIDPENPANQAIRDLASAPRNAQGRIEFSADFFLLKPEDMGRANGALLFEVSNRGRKGILPMFAGATGSLDPTAPEDFGDGFFQRRGFTMLWVGWQFDPPAEPDLLRVYPPAAGPDIGGLVRSDFVVRQLVDSQSLGDRNHVGYPVTANGAATATMTVRDDPDGERQIIARERWSFGRVENGRKVADPGFVTLDGGFQPNRIYEVIYPSSAPPIAGFGLAAVRDAVGALKRRGSGALGIGPGDLDRALAFGLSQSGRMLRQFVYDGFNRDESASRVFDGLLVHIAAGARGSFNHRFAQASRASWSFLYPNAIFPFSDEVQTDPYTGRRDGLLAAVAAEYQPKIIYTNSSNEYWRGSAALTHVSVDGKRDLDLPDNVRSYLLAGTQHVPAAFPPGGGPGQLPPNPNDYGWFLRSLLVELDDWTLGLSTPPPSVVPSLAERELVTRDKLRFPSLPGVTVPKVLRAARAIDFGPAFAEAGVITHEPPIEGGAYPLLLPQVDADGNEMSGLRSPAVAVPLATYTGWNLYDARFGPVQELVSLQGGYIPFPHDAAAAKSAGDPRQPITARYASREAYLGAVTEYALGLIQARYLLAGDLAAVVADARQRWDHAMSAGN